MLINDVQQRVSEMYFPVIQRPKFQNFCLWCPPDSELSKQYKTEFLGETA